MHVERDRSPVVSPATRLGRCRKRRNWCEPVTQSRKTRIQDDNGINIIVRYKSTAAESGLLLTAATKSPPVRPLSRVNCAFDPSSLSASLLLLLQVLLLRVKTPVPRLHYQPVRDHSRSNPSPSPLGRVATQSINQSHTHYLVIPSYHSYTQRVKRYLQHNILGVSSRKKRIYDADL